MRWVQTNNNYQMLHVADRSDQHSPQFRWSTCSAKRTRSDEVRAQMWPVICFPNVELAQKYYTSLKESTFLSSYTIQCWMLVPSNFGNLQLSYIVWQVCSSKGNFCKFIQQWRVAWMRVEMMTVPSGDIDVSTSFSAVPKILDVRSFARKMCGTHSASRRDCSPIICSLRRGDTSRKTNRGST